MKKDDFHLESLTQFSVFCKPYNFLICPSLLCYCKAKTTKAGKSRKGKRKLLESGEWCSKEE